MLEILTLVSLCLAIYFLVRRIARKRGGARVVREATGVSAFIADEVARIVARKLALPREDVTRSMGGEPDADLVSAVERIVARVDVAYEKLPGDQAEVRVEVHFEDGTQQRAARTFSYGTLPESVREELSRSGASQTHRAWAMPWAD